MNSPTIFHRLRFALIPSLWVLLALGPFLHAHWGNSRLTGFHMDDVTRLVAQVHHQAGAVLDTADAPESPALGVATSFKRETRTVDCDKADVALTSGFSLLAKRSHARAALPMPSSHWVQLAAPFSAGWPPPAHAPPWAVELI